jgi:hypothetical protein
MNTSSHAKVNAPAANPESGGEWIVPSVSYVDPSRRFCALCGRPIARRYWKVTIGEQEEVFCEPAHARLHTTYPKS